MGAENIKTTPPNPNCGKCILYRLIERSALEQVDSSDTPKKVITNCVVYQGHARLRVADPKAILEGTPPADCPQYGDEWIEAVKEGAKI